ncbi:MAG: aldo/keto reductase [Coxiellaceae bacterium]|nr:aldo/keto reductase [Coxiellaceae bacterium]
MFRKIGKLSVSSIGLGCMGMSEFYGKTDEKQAVETIHYALDHGVNLLDTADIYGYGDNERLLAKALKGRVRDQVVVATKCGIVRDLNDPSARGLNGSPEYIRQSVENSLLRLDTDYIDLFYLHRIDPNVPIEDSVGMMSQLVAQGKIREIGLSEASANTLMRANAIHQIAAVQTEYSMVSREVESNDVLKACEQLGMAFVAYSPLCRSLLTEAITQAGISTKNDFRQFLPRFNADNLEANQRAIARINQFAHDKGVSLAQLSLAWLLARGDNIVPIPGTKRIEYLQQNIAAMQVSLSTQEIQQLDQLLQIMVISGARYPEEIIEFHNLEG